LWKHTSLSAASKIRIYQAVVVSRALYALSSAWLNAADLRRLNGFHCRCLRKILRIQPSFISRVSNAKVLATAAVPPLGRQLLKQQLLMYGRVARSMATDPLRDVTFHVGLFPATSRFVRRVGRPRNEWATMLHKEALNMNPRFETILHNKEEWKRAVHRYCME
jgi:hypothetical protein